MGPLFRAIVAAGVGVLGVVGVADAQNIYFGNLHAHTSYSDGSGTPAEAFAAAQQGGLHFIAITEHNHARAEAGARDRTDGVLIATNTSLYNGAAASSLTSAAASGTVNGSFVALYGQEFSTISSGNHINVFDAPSVISVPNGKIDQLVSWITQNPDSTSAPPLLQFNHPRRGTGEPKDYGRDDFGGSDVAWVSTLGPYVGLIEVLNAPAMEQGAGLRARHHEREYFGYLNLGFQLAPSVGHDNHYKTWGAISDARVGVYAPSLSKPALLQGLRARRTFASEDKNLRVVFRAGGGVMGDVLPPPAPDTELNLTIELSDPDEPTASYRVDVFKDVPGGEPARRPVESYEFQGDGGPRKLDGVYFEQPGEYVLLRITQISDPDGEHEEEDRVWTAPIWFDFAGPALGPPATIAALKLVALTPDPVGPDLENEAVRLRNTSGASISLSGWQLRDLAGSYWALGAVTIAPGQEVTVTRNGEPLSLNNGGDTIELLDPAGVAVQTFTYGPVIAGQIVAVGP